MGSLKEEKDESQREYKERVKKFIIYSWALMVCMIGGLTLGYWEFEYHPTNRQLWMVPFGLILLVTPLFVWFSIVVSDVCSSAVLVNAPKASKAVPPPDDDSV
ncbi:hypothetical protein CJ030_MR3G019179 [Morella rubra]|uniref:Uncharacterized protein n=1 Tax=Morella rubra TaxID=262757 RepID=A0A6A1W5X8_9ROSI|nr:hypothetical protein CJ030_MR3G019179 [Morella rubra]